MQHKDEAALGACMRVEVMVPCPRLDAEQMMMVDRPAFVHCLHSRTVEGSASESRLW
jgi:hypothetical protein